MELETFVGGVAADNPAEIINNFSCYNILNSKVVTYYAYSLTRLVLKASVDPQLRILLICFNNSSIVDITTHIATASTVTHQNIPAVEGRQSNDAATSTHTKCCNSIAIANQSCTNLKGQAQ